MASKAQRGTKRTCQSNSCGARFYDLARTPIVCPSCGAAYVLALAPAAGEGAAESRRAPKKVAPVVPQEVAEAVAEVPEGDEALAAAAGEEEAGVAEGDETFLEEEEDEGGDVTGIIGEVAEGEEEP